MWKDKLEEKVWQDIKYYQKAKKASLDTRHPGIVVLKDLASKAKGILDLGCGEGTKLNYIADKGKEGVGVDISTTALRLARSSYPRLKFIKADLESLPFKNGQFDLVYSAFVLEHLDSPEKVIDEAIRVTKEGGKLVFIAPNFGAPNRASPPFEGSRRIKLIKGFFLDLLGLFRKQKHLNWTKVNPISLSGAYEIDWDTTVEPYLLTLKKYLGFKGLEIVRSSSLWSEELPDVRFHQKVFRFLGELRVYPFVFGGPHLLVVAQKIWFQK